MKSSALMKSLKGLGYSIGTLGPKWHERSEMYAYKGDYKSPDAVYNGRRKALVYRGFDVEERNALGKIATEWNLSFAYPMKIDDDRIMYSFNGEVNIARQRKNLAIHDILLGK